MGHTLVASERLVWCEGAAAELGWIEWQAGVLRAERPEESAMCRRGMGGRESRLLCVDVKRSASICQRAVE